MGELKSIMQMAPPGQESFAAREGSWRESEFRESSSAMACAGFGTEKMWPRYSCSHVKFNADLSLSQLHGVYGTKVLERKVFDK